MAKLSPKRTGKSAIHVFFDRERAKLKSSKKKNVIFHHHDFLDVRVEACLTEDKYFSRVRRYTFDNL